jgi:hypothetical protein
MPNWCQNKLSVFNVTPELEEYLSKEGFSFEKIVPPNRPENDPNGFATCSAQSDAWGTKWDLDEQEQKDVANQLLINGFANFDTAWAPPSPVIAALAEKFPECEFHLAHFEGGCWFWGIEYYSADGSSSEEHGSGGTAKEAANFLFEYMGFDEEESLDYVGLLEEDEN